MTPENSVQISIPSLEQGIEISFRNALADSTSGAEHPGVGIPSAGEPSKEPDEGEAPKAPVYEPKTGVGVKPWTSTPGVADQINQPSLRRSVGKKTYELHMANKVDREIWDGLLNDAEGPFAKILFFQVSREYNQRKSTWDILATVESFEFKNVRLVK